MYILKRNNLILEDKNLKSVLIEFNNLPKTEYDPGNEIFVKNGFKLTRSSKDNEIFTRIN